MAKGIVSLDIVAKVDGDGKVVKLSGDLKTLQKAIGAAQKSLARPVEIGLLANQVQTGLSSLMSLMGDLTSAYQQQMQVETQLETVMRQRMAATDAEIDSIKRLAAAQQELGVIGDEVQLAGAQQLATFLKDKQALETLLPALNNLLAQQKGYNATATDAVTIGNLFGKVMGGQITALKKVGITFTETEKKMLSAGTETERAAVLAQVITNNVGEMNAALAATPSGKLKQLSNTLGDVKEQLGGYVSNIMPAVSGTNTLLMLGLNATKAYTGLAAAFGASATAVKAFMASFGTASALAAVVASLAAALTALTGTMIGWEKSIDAVAVKQKTLNGLREKAEASAKVEADRLRDLVDIAKDERASMEERNNALRTANSIVPEFNGHIEKTTKALQGNFKALEDYNGALREKYLLEGARETYADLGRQLSAALMAERAAKKALEAEKDRQRLSARGADPRRNISGGANMAPSALAAIGDAGTLGGLEKAAADATARVETLQASLEGLRSEFGAKVLGTEKTPTPSAAPRPSASTAKGGGNKPATPAKESYVWNGELASLKTLEDIAKAEKYVSEQRSKAAFADVANWDAQSKALEEYKNKMLGLTTEVSVEYSYDGDPTSLKTLDDIARAEKYISEQRGKAAFSDVANWDAQADALDNYKKEMLGLTETQEEVAKGAELYAGAVANIGSAISSLGSAVGGAFAEWTKWLGNVATAIAALIPQMVAVINANKADAVSSGISSAMKLPVPFNYIALSANIAAAIAAFAQIPAFAEGGVVYGPTLGLMGEYSGASNNPEVVAPLDKLRSMLYGDSTGEVTFRISGDALEGVLKKRTRKMSRT